jgi:hypothetical protein
MSDKRTPLIDTFANGVRDEIWGAYHTGWGNGNNGVVKEYILPEQDEVILWNGTSIGKRNVVALYGHGERTSSSPLIPVVAGVNRAGSRNLPVTRVGSCMVTRASYGSGRYEFDVKIWPVFNGKNVVPGPPSGTVFSAWTFGYEEHRARPGDVSGQQLNPADLQYQPRFKQGGPGAYYCTMNSEIDGPECGVAGGWTALDDSGKPRCKGNFNTWMTEEHYDVLECHFPNVLDGRYHRYAFTWENQSIPLPDLKPTQVTKQNGYLRINTLGVYPQYQGFAIVETEPNKFSAVVGKEVKFYVDGEFIRSTTLVNAVPAQLVIGNWFASWAGPANWEFCKFTVSRVAIYPKNENDLYLQVQSDGSYLPSIPGSVKAPTLGGPHVAKGSMSELLMRYLGMGEERRPRAIHYPAVNSKDKSDLFPTKVGAPSQPQAQSADQQHEEHAFHHGHLSPDAFTPEHVVEQIEEVEPLLEHEEQKEEIAHDEQSSLLQDLNKVDLGVTPSEPSQPAVQAPTSSAESSTNSVAAPEPTATLPPILPTTAQHQRRRSSGGIQEVDLTDYNYTSKGKSMRMAP